MDSLPIILNDTWRITCDGRLQWIIQRKRGIKACPRPDGTIRKPWESRYYFDVRTHLISCVIEHCGEISPTALAALAKLPERYRVAPV